MKTNRLSVLCLAGALLLTGVSFTSCLKGDDVDTNQYVGGISLNVFGPSPVARGGELRFLGSGMNQVTAVVIPGCADITDINVISDREIRITVPQEAQPGLVTLRTPNGDITTKTELTFTEPISIENFTPATVLPGDELTIEGEYLNLIHEVIFADDVTVTEEDFITHERLIETAEKLKAEKENSGEQQTASSHLAWREGTTVEERLQYALVKGLGDYLDEDLHEALAKYPDAVSIIESPLMSGMNHVGDLFGSGKMFLPQVVKTARTMKKAVAILQPYIEAEKKEGARSAGKVLLATVKGDVHDIGKNIVSVVMACNNYEIIDLGVMVPAEKIVETAIREKVDIIGLSGLITPSLEEMVHVVSELERAGLDIPVMIGGATTSKLHTALKIAPVYHAPVVYMKDASLNAPVAARLMNLDLRSTFAEELESEYRELREKNKTKQVKTVSLEEAQKNKLNLWE